MKVLCLCPSFADSEGFKNELLNSAEYKDVKKDIESLGILKYNTLKQENNVYNNYLSTKGFKSVEGIYNCAPNGRQQWRCYIY